ncbi:hypothetical protein EYF80_058480 [Liparis tanakae]|uniref:Uncharacterized protein n=1 Tax=Liparis tanakae TaxID=230148 RepID=A0A4Z2ER96_9TELE|nr:hypothetical protein EYF80_058480 [Liparis tanakae]
MPESRRPAAERLDKKNNTGSFSSFPLGAEQRLCLFLGQYQLSCQVAADSHTKNYPVECVLCIEPIISIEEQWAVRSSEEQRPGWTDAIDVMCTEGQI